MKTVVKFGTFTDKDGLIHHVAVAGVSDNCDKEIHVYDNEEEEYTGEYMCITKQFAIGFAICNPKDTFNEEIAKQMAVGRAKKKPYCVLVSTHPGIINTVTVDALVTSQLNHIISFPDKYIVKHAKN